MPKLNVIRVKVITESSASALETTLSDFLAAKGTFSAQSPEREFIDIEVRAVSSTLWTAAVIYTE